VCVCKLCLINNGIRNSVFRGWASQPILAFMETGGLFPRLKEPGNVPILLPFYSRRMRILSSHLRLFLPSGPFSSRFSVRSMYVFLFSPVYVTWHLYLIINDLVVTTVFTEHGLILKSDTNNVLIIGPTQPHKSSILALCYALRHVSAIQISNHQVGVRYTKKDIKGDRIHKRIWRERDLSPFISFLCIRHLLDRSWSG